jgi:predicted  nucleic acid-binding Zn-ribbon protein
MAWFLSIYRCESCGKTWTDEWSCMCDDDCPHCGCRHMTPLQSEDLTELIGKEAGEFVVLRSPETAEHDPDYRELGRFPSREQAEAFLDTLEIE